MIVNIDEDDINSLTKMLVKEFGVKEPRRIRNLYSNKLYTKEDMDSKLKNFE